MPNLILPNDILNDTPADAVEVEENYNLIQQWINQELISRDGKIAMQAQLTLVGDPTADKHAATKAYVDAILPIGTIVPYAGPNAPAGGDWLICDGSNKADASYPALAALLQERYGTAPAGQFKLPNLMGRSPVGRDANVGRFNTVGKAGGSSLVPIPEHTHTINHDHGVITSTAESVKHTHTINHNHPSYTTPVAGPHEHSGMYQNAAEVGGASVQVISGTTAVDSTHHKFQVTGTDEGLHSHVVDLPVTTGLISGNDIPSHKHDVNLPLTTGLISGKTKLEHSIDNDPLVKSSTEMVPPYVVINYLIKAR